MKEKMERERKYQDVSSGQGKARKEKTAAQINWKGGKKGLFEERFCNENNAVNVDRRYVLVFQQVLLKSR